MVKRNKMIEEKDIHKESFSKDNSALQKKHLIEKCNKDLKYVYKAEKRIWK